MTDSRYVGKHEGLPVNYSTSANLVGTVQDLDEQVDEIVTAVLGAITPIAADLELMPSELAAYVRRLVQSPRRCERGGWTPAFYNTLARLLDLVEKHALSSDKDSTEAVRAAVLSNRAESYEYATGMRP